MPYEHDIIGVYFPPFVPVFFMSIIAAWLTAVVLNKFRISRIFVWPQLVFVSIVALYFVFFSTFVIEV